MRRVIIFSEKFPAHHPLAGQPTHFEHKILEGSKIHTIRSGNRWQVGDVIVPRKWSGKPYRSVQHEIMLDLYVFKTWGFNIRSTGEYFLNGHLLTLQQLKEIAKNDGFDNLDDFKCWFKLKPGQEFFGQIICWYHHDIYHTFLP